MPANTDTRYWIQTTDDADTPQPDMSTWYAVVDELAGGIVAYAESLDMAQVVRAALIQTA